jgi:hypothetical protein
MLFVPDHGALHSALCKVKDEMGYFNTSPKIRARYKETHLSKFRSNRDVDVAKRWIDLFLQHSCYFRAVVIDWSMWDPRFFGGPFEPDALKKLRAYKKWAEMLLQPELTQSDGQGRFFHAKLYLDRLRIMYGYDVIDYLRERFTKNYYGPSPFIEDFQHADSARDANQCLQLCDLLTGALYQALVPADSPEKRAVRIHLEQSLAAVGVKQLGAGFWRQYAPNTLTQHFPKFSAWFWRPTDGGRNKRRR